MAIDTSTHTPAPRRAVFEDGFGKRHHAVGPGGEPLEVLEFKDDLTTAPSFELAVRERVAAVAGFQHTSFAHVRSVQRLGPNASKLVVISDRVPGARLSTILAVARQQLLPLEVNAALCLIRQLVPAMAMLHEKMPGIAHAALSPERIIITPNARLVIVDHMLGGAVEQLQYSHDRYWKYLRIPLPPAAQPTFDQRADVMQTGLVALALILGRPLDGEDYPDRIGALAEGAWGLTATGGVEPLPAELRSWLGRMLQLDSRQSFGSAVEAWTELERVMGSSDYVASFGALKAFMAEYARTAASTTTTIKPAVAPPMPAPAPPPVPAPVASAAPSPIVPGQTPRPEQASPRPAPAPVAAVTPQPVSAPTSPRPEPSVTSAAPVAVPVEPAEAPRPVVPAPSAPPPAARPPLPPTATTAAAPAAEWKPEQSRNVPWWRQRWAAAAAVLLALASGGTYLGRYYLSAPAVAEASGTLVVTTNPAGVPVLIDNQPRGVTPLTIELAPGSHQLRLVTEGDPRIIPLTITPGGTVSQTLELPKTEPRTGQLVVRTEPSGARVTVDGTPRGNAPLTLDGLAPGSHTVVLANDSASVTHEVTVEPGATASLVVPMSAAPRGAPVSGWIAVATPTEVQIFEDQRLLGTSRSDRIMVTAGRHELDIVNEALGYRATRAVTVNPGQVATLRLDWPKGAMAVNAQPWAEVWINGERVGETPIGNVSVPIGVHEIVFRHPQLGEQVVRATVTADTPARVSVDMRKR